MDMNIDMRWGTGTGTTRTGTTRTGTTSLYPPLAQKPPPCPTLSV